MCKKCVNQIITNTYVILSQKTKTIQLSPHAIDIFCNDLDITGI